MMHAKSANLPELLLPEFSRAFALRTPRMALLLGAGASVTSGVPTANDLVWEFKREIFASETGTHPSRVGSRVDPAVSDSLQKYFDSQSGCPRLGDEHEYSYYFEKAYADSEDRRRFIGKKMDGGRPSYGCLCLGALLLQGYVRIVWTTNFDDLIEQAYSQVSDGRSASVVGLDTHRRFETYLRDERYPIVVKLHGDFRVDSLKNTSAEVQAFDTKLREQLVDQCGSCGLVVVGYSGRDESVMAALAQVLEHHGAKAFPEGLYWCLRETDERPKAAETLLSNAMAAGVRTAFVRIPDFDDFAASLYRSCGTSHALVDSSLAERQRTRAGFTIISSGKVEPALKFNAIPIVRYPESCYRFKSGINSWQDLRELIDGQDIVAGLLKGQVLALAKRTDIQEVFRQKGVEDLHASPIGLDDLRIEGSVTVGMFYDAILKGLTSTTTLSRAARRLVYIRSQDALSAALAKDFADIGIRDTNQVVRRARPGQFWIHEAAELALEYREEKLWLLFKPTIYLTQDGKDAQFTGEDKKEIIRTTLATRYNKHFSGLYTFWLRLIWSCTRDGEVSFPANEEASNATFKLEQTLGTSYYRS